MSETVPEQGTWITHPWVAAGQRKIRFRVCMSSLKSVADVRRKLGVLDRHCEVRGRPPESLLRSHITFPLILAETRTRV